MKKILLSLLAVCSLFLNMQFSMNKVDAGTINIAGPSTVTVGEKFTLNFSIGKYSAQSGKITVLYDSSKLEFVESDWLVDATLESFNGETGGFTIGNVTDISGPIFSVTFKAKTIDNYNSVSVTLVLLDDNFNEVDTLINSASVKSICAAHSWGEWTQVDPTCTTAGSKTHTCSVCGTSETVKLDALGHDVQDWTVVKEPTCTETGIEESVCSRCHQGTSRTVEAKGHDFTAWATLVEATCTSTGTEIRTCKECGYEETRETEMTEHEIGDDYVVIIEPTVTNYGLAEATCVHCGAKFQKQLPCIYVDEETQTEFTFDEGCFPAETTITVSFVDVGEELTEDLQKDAGDALTTASNETSSLGDQIGKLGEMSSGYKIFSLVAKCKDRTVEPSSTVSVAMDVPEDFSEYTAIVQLNEDGSMDILGSQVINGKIKFDLDEFGDYAIVNLKNVTQEDALPFYFLYLLVGSGALIVILSILLLSQKKMRK